MFVWKLNRGQTGGIVGYDINVVPVWLKGITGRGVVLTILDDGIDHNHPDLQHNYVSVSSFLYSEYLYRYFLQYDMFVQFLNNRK